MKLLADAGVDRQIVDRLRKEGHQVLYIAEMQHGLTDDEILEISNREEILLITTDKDFGELIFRQHRITSGILLIRLSGLSATQKGEMVSSAINKHSTELSNAFTVISPKAIRIRKMKK